MIVFKLHAEVPVEKLEAESVLLDLHPVLDQI